MIRLEGLSVGYGGRMLIEGASVEVGAGRLTAMVGRNGAGKSSLLRVIGGIDAAVGGAVLLGNASGGFSNVHGMTVAERARRIAFVTTQRVRIANLRCRDVVGMGRAPYTDWIGRMGSRDREIVEESLRLVGMEAYAERTLDTMSDGECQRVMVARALAQQTEVILLDEPTSFLDVPGRYGICRLLSRLAHEEGKTVLFSTHEIEIALSLCDDVMLVDGGRVVCRGAREMRESGEIERCFGV